MVTQPDQTRVLITMPTYNHEDFVAQAIESVLHQTVEAWTLAVVDDGSTDRTAEIVASYAARDRRIRLIRLRHRGLDGLGDAYNMALGESDAPLVAVLEGDDYWPPTKLARQIPDFDDQHVVLSYGQAVLVDEWGCRFATVHAPWRGAIRSNDPVGSILPALASSNAIVAPSVVMCRRALDHVGGFLQPVGAPYVDHPTWLALATKGTFVYHRETVAFWRRHPAQWTTTSSVAELSRPERSYLTLDALAGFGHTSAAATEVLNLHQERWQFNKFRLALLNGNLSNILRIAGELLATGRPRLIVGVWLGLLLGAIGLDYEYIQRARHRVSWPSRRHLRVHRAQSAAKKN